MFTSQILKYSRPLPLNSKSMTSVFLTCVWSTAAVEAAVSDRRSSSAAGIAAILSVRGSVSGPVPTVSGWTAEADRPFVRITSRPTRLRAKPNCGRSSHSCDIQYVLWCNQLPIDVSNNVRNHFGFYGLMPIYDGSYPFITASLNSATDSYGFLQKRFPAKSFRSTDFIPLDIIYSAISLFFRQAFWAMLSTNAHSKSSSIAAAFFDPLSWASFNSFTINLMSLNCIFTPHCQQDGPVLFQTECWDPCYLFVKCRAAFPGNNTKSHGRFRSF